MTEGDVRRGVGAALTAYALVLAFMLLVPRGEVPSRSLGVLARVAQHLGAPEVLLAPTRFEFVANVLVVVPVVVAAAWLRPQVRWAQWTAYGFMVSVGVEAIQAVFYADRSATFADVVANTAGALLGSMIGVALHRSRGDR